MSAGWSWGLLEPEGLGRGMRWSGARMRRGGCAARRCGRRPGAPRAAWWGRRRRGRRGWRGSRPARRRRRRSAAPGAGAMRGISPISEGASRMPGDAADGLQPDRAEGRVREARGRRTRSASIGRVGPSATTARSRGSRAAASSSTSAPSEVPKPAIRCGSTSGRRLSQSQRGVDGGLGVVAESVRVALALAVARVVERQHAVAVAGEHADVGGDALAAAARAVAEEHGRAVARRDVPGRTARARPRSRSRPPGGRCRARPPGSPSAGRA